MKRNIFIKNLMFWREKEEIGREMKDFNLKKCYRKKRLGSIIKDRNSLFIESWEGFR